LRMVMMYSLFQWLSLRIKPRERISVNAGVMSALLP
jgi:hypothetical protein